jgi:hypothetical protein
MTPSESIQFVALAAGDGESIFKLIVPVVIIIFYIIAAIGKAKKGDEEGEGEEQEQHPQAHAGRPTPQQQRPMQQRTPSPLPQRPAPQQRPGPMQMPGQMRPIARQAPQPQRPMPVPQQRPASPESRKGMFERVSKPISTAQPASVGKLEKGLHEKAERAEREPERVLHAERVVDMALKPTVIPTAEVATVESVDVVVDLTEVQLDVRSIHKLREAIILREILDKPVALR